MWIGWKADRCPTFTRDVVSTSIVTSMEDTPPAKRRKVSGMPFPSSRSSGGKKRKMAIPTATLVAPKDNMASLSVEKMSNAPDMDAFLQKMRDAIDPMNCIEDEYHPKHDMVYNWRGLRLMSKTWYTWHDQPLDKAVMELDGTHPVEEKEEAGSVEEGAPVAASVMKTDD